MNKLIKASMMIGLLFSMLPLAAGEKLQVVATLPVLGSIAQEVGGDKINLTVLAGSSQDPHFIEPKPSFLLKLMQADVFIEAGLDLEAAWTGPLLSDSRNRNIQFSEPGYCDTHKNIRILEIPETKVSRLMGDVHVYGNPHYWMDPVNGIIIARNIADTFILNDPANEEWYEQQYNLFRENVKKSTVELLTLAKPQFGMKVAGYHKEWTYFCNRFRFEIVAHVEPKPGVEPTLLHIRKLNQILNEQQVKWVMTTPYNRGNYSGMIEKETGAKVLILPAGTGLLGAETYMDMFKVILDAMGIGADA